MQSIRHIAEIFEPNMDKTTEIVRWEMTELLNWIKQTYIEELDLTMVTNLLSYSKGFWKGLFTC